MIYEKIAMFILLCDIDMATLQVEGGP